MTTLTEPRTKADWEEMLELAVAEQDRAYRAHLCSIDAFNRTRRRLDNARHALQHIRQNIIALEKAGQA